ncbi:MAG: hypothetical protein QNJ90_06645 [Planctomycetota bacterium]|nr:hypothetical protein [Planctomycetota bacterium]
MGNNTGGIGLPTPSGGRGGRSVGAAPRLTYFKWTEVAIGKIQAVTPKEGEAPRGPVTAEEHLRKLLGFEAAKLSGDKRPLLVYFHYPHDHPKHGKLSTAVCSRTLDDEQAARWSKMFRCVQIDMGATETQYADMIGHKGMPLFVALDPDLKVVAEIPVTKSGAKLKKALEGAFKKFPKAVKQMKKDIAQHKKWMAQAKALEKKDEFDKAVELVDKIRFGDVRISPYFDKAQAYGQRLALKAEREGLKR